MGIIEILKDYIEHQKEVLTNRSNFELEKAKKRAHIVDGLIGMVSILDAVIATIKNSKNKADAKENLVNIYGFTELQAEAIVMLHLYRLTNTDIFELKKEQKELQQEIQCLYMQANELWNEYKELMNQYDAYMYKANCCFNQSNNNCNHTCNCNNSCNYNCSYNPNKCGCNNRPLIYCKKTGHYGN
jgi:DNA gyrase/topoisomerase IV subunit A